MSEIMPRCSVIKDYTWIRVRLFNKKSGNHWIFLVEIGFMNNNNVNSIRSKKNIFKKTTDKRNNLLCCNPSSSNISQTSGSFCLDEEPFFAAHLTGEPWWRRHATTWSPRIAGGLPYITPCACINSNTALPLETKIVNSKDCSWTNVKCSHGDIHQLPVLWKTKRDRRPSVQTNRFESSHRRF